MQEHFPKDTFQKTVSQLEPKFGHQEGQALTYIILDKLFGFSRTDIIINQPSVLESQKLKELDLAIKKLLSHEPIQYIFQEASFLGNTFYVNPHVLIPRQETELLIQIISNYKKWNHPRIIDIGTGSGCIACSLALSIDGAQVHGYDISDEALRVAEKNSKLLKANVNFSLIDILTDEIPEKDLDIIVSNPPYVMLQEKSEMKNNVLDYEPHLALFVDDNDPLLFYRTILEKGKVALKKEGLIFFEINEQFGKETISLLERMGYTHTKLYDDLNGKPRFASGVLK